MAFPTTGVLDNFNRTDADPLVGNWSLPIFVGDGGFAISGNAAIRSAASGGQFGSTYWNLATFGPNSEVFFTVAARGADSFELLLRITQPGGASTSGYLMDVTGSTWTIWKIVNTVQTQLAGSGTQTVANGDGVGFEAKGNALTAYYKAGAGAWASVFTVNDATNPGAGNIGMIAQNRTGLFDDFGGGTIVAASSFVPQILGYA